MMNARPGDDLVSHRHEDFDSLNLRDGTTTLSAVRSNTTAPTAVGTSPHSKSARKRRRTERPGKRRSKRDKERRRREEPEGERNSEWDAVAVTTLRVGVNDDRHYRDSDRDFDFGRDDELGKASPRSDEADAGDADADDGMNHIERSGMYVESRSQSLAASPAPRCL